MRLFLKQIFLFLCFFIAVMAAVVSYQLYYVHKIWGIIPDKEPVLACDIDKRPNTKTINLIGCSNLKFNIDVAEIRKQYTDVNVNKYTFAGALNSCYLKYLVANIRADGNHDKFIVYLPTDLFFRENTYPHHPFFNQFGISKDFLTFLFKENPMILISENWAGLYKSIAQYHYPNYTSIYRYYTTDMELDSLIHNKTSFSECNFPFDKSKHQIRNPLLTSKDAQFFNSIFGKENYSIINSPIPNISEHLKYDYSIFAKCGFNKPLDPPDSVICDSSLFYDQWYHQNNCGRIIQTGKFIREMDKLHLNK